MRPWRLAGYSFACLLLLAAVVALIMEAFRVSAERPRRTVPVVASALRHFGDTLQIDLGKTWFAQVTVDGSAFSPGTELAVRMGERLSPDGRLAPEPYGSVRFQDVTIETGAGSQLVPLAEWPPAFR